MSIYTIYRRGYDPDEGTYYFEEIATIYYGDIAQRIYYALSANDQTTYCLIRESVMGEPEWEQLAGVPYNR